MIPHRANPTDGWRAPAVIGLLLVGAGLMSIDNLKIIDVGICLSGLIALVVWGNSKMSHGHTSLSGPSGPSGGMRHGTGLRSLISGGVKPLELILYLSPVLLLSVAYPLASGRIAHDSVGGVHLTTMLLGASVTVPWLTQAVCLPLYRALALQIEEGDSTKLRARLCEVWPSAYGRSVPTILLFAIPVEATARWSLTAIGVYLALCLLYVAFAQSLIFSIVSRNRWLWASAWAALALTLLIAPALWFLPPLAALVTQLIPLRRYLHRMTKPVSLGRSDVIADLARGLLLGSVLWGDKFLLFVKSGSHFAVVAVFLGLLPAVLAYNYYFVRLAPRFDTRVRELRTAMENESSAQLAERSVSVWQYVAYSMKRTGLAAAILVVLVTAISGVVSPKSMAVVSTVGIASWLFMMTTLACYKLDYIGRRSIAQAYSAIHLAGCILVFSLVSFGPGLYEWLIAMEVGVFAAASYSVRMQWRLSEYNLFWRHATAW